MIDATPDAATLIAAHIAAPAAVSLRLLSLCHARFIRRYAASARCRATPCRHDVTPPAISAYAAAELAYAVYAR